MLLGIVFQESSLYVNRNKIACRDKKLFKINGSSHRKEIPNCFC